MAEKNPAGAAPRPHFYPQLLRTKLYVPQTRPELVARPRLSGRLDEILAKKLVVISAPAGFGKTTALSVWVARCQARGLPVAWISLDERDNEPGRFWANVVAALADIGQASAPYHWPIIYPDTAVTDDTIVEVLNAVVAAGLPPFILVLDDFHLITAASIHHKISFLVDFMPPQMHLAIAGRSDPPLMLAQLRARGHLAELRPQDLRFTAAETQQFLNQVMALGLPDEAVAVLDARAEGWIAGLQLAALSMRDRHDREAFIQAFTGSHRYIMDYLTEQVLHHQPEDVQSFLLETSILDKLCGPLCDTVTGRSGSQATLERLDTSNLFLVSMDDERNWYRYHHLFGSLLRVQLEKTGGDARTLHRRAAAWYEENNLLQEAVSHALEGRDFRVASRIIGALAQSNDAHSQPREMLGWLSALPEEIVRSRPLLSLGFAWMSAINGQLEAVEPLLEPVEAWLNGNGAAHGSVDTGDAVAATPMANEDWNAQPEEVVIDVDLLRAYVSRFLGSPGQAVARSARALQRIPPDNLRLQAIAWLCNGHGHLLENNLAAADHGLQQAVELGRASGHIAAYLSATHYHGQLRELQGRLRDALAIYEGALDHVNNQTLWRFSGIERIGIGNVYLERNDMDAAQRLISDGLERVEAGGDFVFLRDGYLTAARLAQARGEHERALQLADLAGEAVRQGRSNWDASLVAAWRARLLLQQGNLAEAARWADRCGLRVNDGLGMAREVGLLTLARVQLAQGEIKKSEHLLGCLLRLAEQSGQTGNLLQVLALQALTYQALGEPETAFAILRRALQLAKPEGYVRLFLDHGQPMAELMLWGMARREWIGARLVDYVSHLLQQFGLTTSDATPLPDDSVAADPMVEPLSDRELEVLRLVAAGASNREAADRLFVTVNTVRSHLRHINEKLHTHSRSQAVARARALRLLL